MLIRWFIVLSLLCAAPGFAHSEPSGAAQTIDGDTLNMDGQVINLFAVAAPGADQVCREWAHRGERSYQCGAHARAFLASLIAGAWVECVREDTDADADTKTTASTASTEATATCYVAGRDLGLALVQAGWALAARNQSSRYVGWENAARRAKLGLWAGSFTQPGRVRIKP